MKFFLVVTVLLADGQIKVMDQEHPTLSACLDAGFSLSEDFSKRVKDARLQWDCVKRDKQ